MTSYGSLILVKQRLNLDPDNVDQDVRITRALAQANDYIDNELQTWTTVPLASPPDVIVQIANDWAAGIIRLEVTNPTSTNPTSVKSDPANIFPGSTTNVFIEQAKASLKRYIRVTYMTPH